MNNLRIGILCHGTENDVWGSMIITHYLEGAFKRLGHDVWRISVTEHNDYPRILSKQTDLLICEGVPEWQVPKGVWENANIRIFFWESELFYNIETLTNSNFDAVVTNSNQVEALKAKGVPACRVNLAVDKDIDKMEKRKEYESEFVFVGRYPHKTEEQMSLFKQIVQVGQLSLWGTGWENSIYHKHYKGILPLYDIGSLYKSVDISILLTEEKQKRRGMFNNRVYEVLGSGAIALSERYEELENSDLGEFISFPKSLDEIQDIYDRRNSHEEKKRRLEAQKYVLSHHNYDVRAAQILEFYKNL